MLKAETSSKAVTPSQIKFLRALHDRGPMTAKELASMVGKDLKYTHSVVYTLRESGLIERTLEGVDPRTKGRVSWRYKLVVPLESVEIKLRSDSSRKVPDEEIRYVAILRNGGLTGHELEDQFQKVYPHRPETTIRSTIIPRAKRKRWCR